MRGETSIKADVAVIGGGVGGVACALAAAEAGLRVVLTEESDWVGGQFTSQATPPDEHGWIESFGCTKSYRRLRDEARKHYRTVFPLTPEAQAAPFFNPGNGWVSPLCAEPLVFLTILEAWLTKQAARGRLRILLRHRPVAAETDGDNVRAVALEDLREGRKVTVEAGYFVDATELGDLLPLAGVESVTGAEAHSETGEPHAKAQPEPRNSQAFSVCFALSYDEHGSHTITKPENYEFWRDFTPALEPPWGGPLLRLKGLSPRTLQPIEYRFAPHLEENRAFAGLWTYRRILHRDNFVAGAYASDVTLVNYPQIDCLAGDLVTADVVERQRLIAQAREQSRSFLYWLQTEAGFKGLRLRPDVLGTNDGLAKMPYVRESRRIRAEFTVTEQRVAAACRAGQTLAEPFADSVGIGFYRIDLHPTCGGDNYLDVEALPFQIPLGALLPARVENLLPACKNIGTTHITNGCYRLHPVEWNVGEAVGALLAFCAARKTTPRATRNDAALRGDFQRQLTRRGVELAWPDNLNLADGDPHRHAM
jgi:hypothetical protein